MATRRARYAVWIIGWTLFLSGMFLVFYSHRTIGAFMASLGFALTAGLHYLAWRDRKRGADPVGK